MINLKKYNPQIHHRSTIRLQDYDYSQAGLYFITICCHERKCLFGNIINQTMFLSDAGKIADDYWRHIPDHFPNTILHEHIIMPNHVHGIIELTTVGVEHFQPQPNGSVGVEHFQPQKNAYQRMIPRSIGAIVKGYKIGVTKWFRTECNEDFPKEQQIWQRNYYEHIIRDEQAYGRISTYIFNNPVNWKDDKFYY